MLGLRPQPDATPRRGPAGASRPLFSTGSADPLDQKSVDSTVGVISGNARQTAVNDQSDGLDGNRRFRNVSRNDNFGLVIFRDGSVLLPRRQLSVQRQQNVTL